MGISNRIMQNLKNYNSDMAIIFDGEFIMYKRKIVYATIKNKDADGDDSVLNLYVKQKTENGNTEKLYVTERINLEQMMNKNHLYGVELQGLPEQDSGTIKIDADLNIIIIESMLYNAAKSLALDNGETKTFMFGGTSVPLNEAIALKNAFLHESYKVYGRLVYTARMSRFVSRASKIDRFFSIQKTFVPVFVDYEHVFNPWRLDTCPVKQKQLYQRIVAMESRRVERGPISAYMITHKELCQLLHMEEFMRFSSHFFNGLLCGFMFPGDPDYYSDSPDNTNQVRVKSPNYEYEFLTQQVYKPKDVAKIIEKYRKGQANGFASDDEKTYLEGCIAELQQCVEISSLYAGCIANLNVMQRMGPSKIDKGTVRAETIYNIVRKAKYV